MKIAATQKLKKFLTLQSKTYGSKDNIGENKKRKWREVSRRLKLLFRIWKKLSETLTNDINVTLFVWYVCLRLHSIVNSNKQTKPRPIKNPPVL